MMQGVYETTSFCPFTGNCESYMAIVNGERWMQKALSELRRSGKDKLPKSEGGYSDNILMSKLDQLKQVKCRCYNYNRRCLRFWQLDKKSKEDKSMKILTKHILPIFVEPPKQPI